jgi:hypothetical protein
VKMLQPKTLRTLATARPSRVLGEGYSDDLKLRKRWYRSHRWQRLRTAHLAEHPYCVLCAAEGQTVLATVVDHAAQHLDAGWRERFWDTSFLRSLCRAHHQVTVGRESAARKRRHGHWGAGRDPHQGGGGGLQRRRFPDRFGSRESEN